MYKIDIWLTKLLDVDIGSILTIVQWQASFESHFCSMFNFNWAGRYFASNNEDTAGAIYKKVSEKTDEIIDVIMCILFKLISYTI